MQLININIQISIHMQGICVYMYNYYTYTNLNIILQYNYHVLRTEIQTPQMQQRQISGCIKWSKKLQVRKLKKARRCPKQAQDCSVTHDKLRTLKTMNLLFQISTSNSTRKTCWTILAVACADANSMRSCFLFANCKRHQFLVSSI